jgi:hypothetical protein
VVERGGELAVPLEIGHVLDLDHHNSVLNLMYEGDKFQYPPQIEAFQRARMNRSPVSLP